MNLLVTILSLTPAVGAVFRLLEERPTVTPPAEKRRQATTKRRIRRQTPRRGNHARLATWRYAKIGKPLRALRAP